jgi:hypothetical protein
VDPALGGSGAEFLDAPVGDDQAAQAAFNKVNQWAIQPEVLALLLRPELRDRIPVLMHEFIGDFGPITLSQQISLTQCNYRYRARYHLGQVMWAMSFQLWPIMPALEPEMLEAAIHLPLRVVSRRALQLAYVCRCHPSLAAIPLDRNSHDFRAVNGHASRRLIKWPRWRDPRRYHRIFKPDHAAWRLIRRTVDPHRALLDDLFDVPALSRCWPAAQQRWPVGNPFSDPAGGKNLIALAWRKSMMPNNAGGLP